ncbi:MAG: GNAT family N-acetyltransferase [Lachnospiraceae bacterium]|nr:GNAT family N-acetyltransferase [Lachnospiraceae bacterium]
MNAKKGMVIAIMKNSFCLKSDTVKITPSNMEDIWESDWIITSRKDENEQLGTASFAGEKLLGAVPLNVELMPKYRNRGLGTEIIRMMVNWAFLHKNIFEVVSKVEHENDKGVNALQKAGFVYRGNEENIETYTIIKAKPVWTGVYIIVGVFVGLTLGIVLNSLLMGFVIGIAAGLSVGAIMDNNALKYRESVTGKNEHHVKHSKS